MPPLLGRGWGRLFIFFKMKKKHIFAFFCIISIVACGQLKNEAQRHPSTLDFAKFPLKNLSEYGFFEGDMAGLSPNTDVLLYEPTAPLFSDYAFKKRFVWMPKGSAATCNPADTDAPFEFPDKAILIKNFYYPTDFAKPEGERRIIETRLLVKQKGEWIAYPYQWNAEQTEAKYKVTGGITPVSWQDEHGVAQSIKYSMPNKNQCKSCHNRDGKMMPIGPKLKQLNCEIAYTDGKENQLDRWKRVGYLKTEVDKSSIMTLTHYTNTDAPLADRARSYLDVNCGHCHNKKGTASSSGLNLLIEEKDPFHWGVLKSPVAAGIGAGDFKFDILPGKADESIIPFRMNSTHPGIMMPEVGRVSIHKEGVDLIKAWINGLKNS
jgi:uncharacterized repeat protein (TIGR03806 family)